MKIATVTGISGFIGGHFTKRLLELGWIVYGVDLSSNFPFDFEQYSNFHYYGKDIVKLESLPDCDFVFNFAAETHVSNSIEDCSKFIYSNIDGVRNLLELIRKKPNNVVKKPVLFHISTDEVYGDILTGFSKETDSLNPSNPYAVSKAAADMLILSWARTYGLDYTIVRPTNNYGTNQHPEKLIPLTIKLAKWGQPIRLHNRGTPKRTWLHVEDTVDAILALATLNESGISGIYNISGNIEQTNLATVSKILWHMNFKNVDQYLDLNHVRPGQDLRYSVDDSKLKSIGWSPKRHFDDEIKKIVDWYLENPNERLFLLN